MVNKKGGEIFEVPLINLKKKRRKLQDFRRRYPLGNMNEEYLQPNSPPSQEVITIAQSDGGR